MIFHFVSDHFNYDNGFVYKKLAFDCIGCE